MKPPRMIMEVTYDPKNPAHTTERYIHIMREQATRLESCVWGLGPSDRIEIRDPDTHELAGHFRFEPGEP